MNIVNEILILVLVSLSEISSTGIVRQDCKCGEGNLLNHARIVAGTETNPHKYPWQAAMFSPQGFMCGGSIISDKNILTAGHCVFYVPNVYETYWVLGMHDQVLQDGTRHYVQHYVLHPNFHNFSVYDDFDMALVTLVGRIQFNVNVHPICLTTPMDDYTGKMVIVSGWGKLGDSQASGLGTRLQETKVRVKPNPICAAQTARVVNFNQESMLCAHAPNTDACNGDSGGPLFLETDPNRFELIGVVSFGDGCARDFPGIYGRINTAATQTWIKQYVVNTDGNVCTDPSGKTNNFFDGFIG